MRVIRSPRQMQAWGEAQRKKGKTIGFVPTMGYLHEGHASLLRAARKECDVSVLSIFVNPAQFGPKEDLAKYPRDLGADLALARREKVDIVFVPSLSSIYPPPFRTTVELKRLSDKLCGISRPTHFAGVCLVVAKLFNLVKPHVAYFGQKDFQQTVVVRQMARDLNFGLSIKVLPTAREKDGLALSSRNVYLSPEERVLAPTLYRALQEANRAFLAGTRSAKTLRAGILRRLKKTSCRLDYVEIADPSSLESVTRAKKGDVIALACFFGKTRLIDNVLLGARKCL